MSKIVKIIINQTVKDSSLHPDDLELGLPSDVEVVINEDVPLEYLANCALDIFHEAYAIKVLDDFELTVHYNGEEIEQDLNLDSYTYSKMGYIA